jgi:hypothetical protein
MQASPSAPRQAASGSNGTDSSVQGKTKHHGGAQGQGPADTTQQTDGQAGRTVIVVNQQPPEGKDADHAQKPPSYLSRLFGPENLPNIALVIVATLTALFIASQARETARATQAVRDSLPHQEQAARAALRNAEALINAERAWIIPELKCLCTQRDDNRWYKPDGSALTMEEVLRGKHLKYILKLTNMGRTPANVTGFQITYTLLPEGVRDLPPDARGDSTYRGVNKFVAAGESGEIFEPIIDVGTYTTGHWLPIRALEETAVFHGWVKYRHMFSTEEDQADFCYVYTVSLNRLSAVGKYTKYTQEGKSGNHV